MRISYRELARLAELSYRTSLQTEREWSNSLGKHLSDWSGWHPFIIDDHEGFIVWNDDDAVIVFRGSDRSPDWFSNFWSKKVSYPSFQNFQLHSGYSDPMPRIWNKIGTRLHELYQFKNLHFVGHSKGAALATVCAFWCTDRAMKPYSLTTFASPRCVNSYVRDHLEQIMPGRIRRFVNCMDIVPQAWFTLGYSHVGSEYYFDREGFLRIAPSFNWKMWDRLKCFIGGKTTLAKSHSMAIYRKLVEANNG